MDVPFVHCHIVLAHQGQVFQTCKHLLLHPLEDKARKELDKLLHANDVILMRLLCIEFDSKLLFAAACLTWLHSVTRLKYIVDPTLFPH